MRFSDREVEGKKIFDEEEDIRRMYRAMELGVNYFDTTPGYCAPSPRSSWARDAGIPVHQVSHRDRVGRRL